KECHPDVYILSAQFGLIPAHQPISNYNCRMTPQRAGTVQPQVLDQLRHILRRKQYKELFISVGRDYAAALAGYAQIIPSHISVTVATGSRGRKQAKLYDWLHGGPPLAPLRGRRAFKPFLSLSPMRRGLPRIRGVTITLTPEQVFETAREALAKTSNGPS